MSRRARTGQEETVDGIHIVFQLAPDTEAPQIDVGDDAADADHFVTAGVRLKIAMARQ